jgi:hypothetical protein
MSFRKRAAAAAAANNNNTTTTTQQKRRERKKNPAKRFLDVYNLPPKPTGAANVKSTGVFESFFLLLLRPFKKKNVG